MKDFADIICIWIANVGITLGAWLSEIDWLIVIQCITYLTTIVYTIIKIYKTFRKEKKE